MAGAMRRAMAAIAFRTPGGGRAIRDVRAGALVEDTGRGQHADGEQRRR